MHEIGNILGCRRARVVDARLDPLLQFLPLLSMDDRAKAEQKILVNKYYYYEPD